MPFRSLDKMFRNKMAFLYLFRNIHFHQNETAGAQSSFLFLVTEDGIQESIRPPDNFPRPWRDKGAYYLGGSRACERQRDMNGDKLVDNESVSHTKNLPAPSLFTTYELQIYELFILTHHSGLLIKCSGTDWLLGSQFRRDRWLDRLSCFFLGRILFLATEDGIYVLHSLSSPYPFIYILLASYLPTTYSSTYC